MYWVGWKVSLARCCWPLSSSLRCCWLPSLSWRPRSAQRSPVKRKRTPAPHHVLPGGWPELSYTSLTWGLHEYIKHSSDGCSWEADIWPQIQKDISITVKRFRWLCWPAAVAEDEEEHTEDDAGDSDVNTDYDACSGCFAMFIFHTVTWGIQHWGDNTHSTCLYQQDMSRRCKRDLKFEDKRWDTWLRHI